jgi:cytochrome c
LYARAAPNNNGKIRLSAANFQDNILVQNAPLGDYEIETRVLFTPTQNFQLAGLTVQQDDNNKLILGRDFCDAGLPVCVGNGIYFDYLEGGTFTGSNFAMTTLATGVAYLKLIRHFNEYTGYVSTDGANWTLVGTHTAAITPTMIGLRTSNQVAGAAEIPADFDYFSLTDNSYHLFLPLVQVAESNDRKGLSKT